MSSARSARSTGSRATTSRRSNSPDAPAGEQPGLRRLVQQRFLKDVFQIIAEKWPGWKILILDEHSTHVISAAVGMYDIMERKITLVESLDKKRAPFPDMGAIYFLEPSEASVSRLIADFSGSKPLYGDAVFLYFLGRLSDRLLNTIKGCMPLLKKVKALSEINIDFLTKEERAFSLDMPDVFTSIYLRRQRSPAELAMAEKLVTVCATLNEYPHIRYKQTSAVCTSLASIFHLKMDEFVAQNPTWWYHGGPQKNNMAQRERGTLLLLDRADDCLCPLMHDFTYQAMVHDLLPMEGDRITYESETTGNNDSADDKKDVLLDERDALWVELRGKHIAQVIETLSSRIRDIMNSSTASVLGKKNSQPESGNISLSQMAAALKALPEYREVMSKLSQHMHIAHNCMDVFRAQNLLELSDLEQTLATGKDDEGRSPKLAELMDRAERMMMKMKNSKDRLRLMLIATISQGGLKPQDRQRLLNTAELSRSDMKALQSLENLGLSLVAAADKNRLVSMLTGGRVNAAGATDDEAEYAGSRFAPALKFILEELAADELSLEDYPSVLPMPEMGPGPGGSAKKGSTARNSRRAGEAASARKSTGPSSRWSKSTSGGEGRSTGPSNFSGGRNIVFVVGGLSYAEMRVAREVTTRVMREVVIGSTTFISPKDFMADLEKLGAASDQM